MNIPAKKMADIFPFHEIGTNKARVDVVEGGMDSSNNDAGFRGSARGETSCFLMFTKGKTGDHERIANEPFDENCCSITEMFGTFQ